MQNKASHLTFRRADTKDDPFYNPLCHYKLSTSPTRESQVIPLLSFPFTTQVQKFQRPSTQEIQRKRQSHPVPKGRNFQTKLWTRPCLLRQHRIQGPSLFSLFREWRQCRTIKTGLSKHHGEQELHTIQEKQVPCVISSNRYVMCCLS